MIFILHVYLSQTNYHLMYQSHSETDSSPYISLIPDLSFTKIIFFSIFLLVGLDIVNSQYGSLLHIFHNISIIHIQCLAYFSQHTQCNLFISSKFCHCIWCYCCLFSKVSFTHFILSNNFHNLLYDTAIMCPPSRIKNSKIPTNHYATIALYPQDTFAQPCEVIANDFWHRFGTTNSIFHYSFHLFYVAKRAFRFLGKPHKT